MRKELGKITTCELLIEDHGILTLSMTFDFGGSGQGIGGYALDTFDRDRDRRVGTAGGLDFVLRTLNLFKVDRLRAIVGRTAFAVYATDRGIIDGIEIPAHDGGGIFMFENWRREWFPGKDGK